MEVKAKIKEILPGFDDKKQFFKLESHQGPSYTKICQDILEFLQNIIMTQKTENE